MHEEISQSVAAIGEKNLVSKGRFPRFLQKKIIIEQVIINLLDVPNFTKEHENFLTNVNLWQSFCKEPMKNSIVEDELIPSHRT